VHDGPTLEEAAEKVYHIKRGMEHDQVGAVGREESHVEIFIVLS
jgi:hypothetical protein